MISRKKKYRWFATLIVLVGLGIWISSRWHAWFYNPDEAPYTVSETPTRVLLTFGNHGELSRYVSWMAGDKVDEKACLILATDTDTLTVPATGEVFESRAGKAAYYRAEMKHLHPSHDYTYSVVTNGEKSPWYHFRTHDPKEDTFALLYMGDVQDTIHGVANKLLKTAVRRHPEIEFVAFGGDLTERPTDAYFAETYRDIDSVCTAMPIINITGNHDYLKYLIRKCERRFALVFPYFLKGMEERGDENHLFTIRYHNTDFYLLDSDRELWYLYQQRVWLNCQIEKSRGEHKIVLVHHPMYSVKKESNNLIQRWMFNDIIQKAGVDLVLQGHEHGYTHCTADEHPLKGHDCRRRTLYTVSHCSPKNYTLHPAKRFWPVKSGSRYYQIVRVNRQSVTMLAYDANTHQLIDSVRISR